MNLAPEVSEPGSPAHQGKGRAGVLSHELEWLGNTANSLPLPSPRNAQADLMLEHADFWL